MGIDSSGNVWRWIDYPEDSITMSIINHFQIKHCIYVKDSGYSENGILNLKNLFMDGLMAVVMNFEQMVEYLKMGPFVYVEMMVIVKDKNLRKMVEFFEDLQNVCT